MLQVAVLEDEQESQVQIKRCLERNQAETHAEWGRTLVQRRIRL